MRNRTSVTKPIDQAWAVSGNGDWQPSASIAVLHARAIILQQLREFFRRNGYWEVETPLLSRDICIDASIDPFPVGNNPTWYLQTSPEFALKRLLVSGADAVFEITRSFRQGEIGRLHNPEFTIVEWYRAASTCHEQMDFVEQLINSASDAIPEATSVRSRATSFDRLTYEEAFLKFAGVSALRANSAELRERATSLQVVVPDSLSLDDRDGWLNLLLAEVVEPGLAELGTVFLYDYPESQSAIARVRSDNPPVAERFELYLDGIEICNGYQELTDPSELLRRMEDRNQQRIRSGQSALPENSRLSAAMQGGRLPECSGVALGFDRLVMWLLGKSSVADVMSFSFDRA